MILVKLCKSSQNSKGFFKNFIMFFSFSIGYLYTRFFNSMVLYASVGFLISPLRITNSSCSSNNIETYFNVANFLVHSLNKSLNRYNFCFVLSIAVVV